jgi:hypothetical protein
MGRYYFHLSGRSVSDEEGEEFPSPEAAVAEANRVARELARNHPASDPHSILRVTNERGEEVATIHLQDMLPP